MNVSEKSVRSVRSALPLATTGTQEDLCDNNNYTLSMISSAVG